MSQRDTDLEIVGRVAAVALLVLFACLVVSVIGTRHVVDTQAQQLHDLTRRVVALEAGK